MAEIMDLETTPIPIHTLDPNTSPESSASIRAVVSLTWPYSSSSHSSALLLAEPDFRLRSRRGQVRVRFTGACADAVASAGLQIGDSVLLRLNGARWGEIGDGVVQTPGKSVEEELIYSKRLGLRVCGKANGTEEVWNDVIVDEDDREVHRENSGEVILDTARATRLFMNGDKASLATPAPKRKNAFDTLTEKEIDETIYSSPAFGRIGPSQDAAWLNSIYDPFNDNDVEAELERPAKRQKRSFGGVRWRLAHASLSPPREMSNNLEGDGSSLHSQNAAEHSVQSDHAREVKSDEQQSTGTRHETENAEKDDTQAEADSSQRTRSLLESDFLWPQMLPPPPPGLRTSRPGQNAVMGDPMLNEDGPATPRLNPVDTSTLPLPSPFPVEGTQFPFASSTTVASTSTCQSLIPSSAPEMTQMTQSTVQDFASTGHLAASNDASSYDLDGNEVDRPSLQNCTESSPEGASSDEEVEQDLDEEHDHYEDTQMGELAESDVDEVIEISDGDEPPGSDEELMDEAVQDTGEADSPRDLIETHALPDMGQSNALDETRAKITTASETRNDAITTPTKDTSLNVATSFGFDGTSSAPSSEHVMPQSRKEKVMAQTLNSLFGFKESTDAVAPPDFEQAVVVEPVSPTPAVVISAEDALPNQNLRNIDMDKVLAIDARSHDSKRGTQAAPSLQWTQVAEIVASEFVQPISEETHAIPATSGAPSSFSQDLLQSSEAASHSQTAETESERSLLPETILSQADFEIRGTSADNQADYLRIAEADSHDVTTSGTQRFQSRNDDLLPIQYKDGIVEIPDSVDMLDREFDLMSGAPSTLAVDLVDSENQESRYQVGDSDAMEDVQREPVVPSDGLHDRDYMSPTLQDVERVQPDAVAAGETSDNATEQMWVTQAGIEDPNEYEQISALHHAVDTGHEIPLETQILAEVEVLPFDEAQQAVSGAERAAIMPGSRSRRNEVDELDSSSPEGDETTAHSKHEDVVVHGHSGASGAFDAETRDDKGMFRETQLHSTEVQRTNDIRPPSNSREMERPVESPIGTSLVPKVLPSPLDTQLSSHDLAEDLAEADAEIANHESGFLADAIPPTHRLTQGAASLKAHRELDFPAQRTADGAEPAFASQIKIRGPTMTSALTEAHSDDGRAIAERNLIVWEADDQVEHDSTWDHAAINASDQAVSTAPALSEQIEVIPESIQPASITAESAQQVDEELQSSAKLAAILHEECVDRESPVMAKKKTPSRKAKNSRPSFVPDVVKEWFSPRRSSRLAKYEPGEEQQTLTTDKDETKTHPIEEGMTLRNGHKLGQESSDSGLATPGFSTSLAYFAPLAALSQFVNSSSQHSASRTVDVFAIVTEQTREPQRAKGGPKDFFTIFRIVDQSLSAESSIRVEIFRPWMATLPVASAGDIILLRGLSVKSRRRLPYLISTDSSAWCVWRYEEHGHAEGLNSKKPAWARRRGGIHAGAAREEIKGPPVEFGAEEKLHVHRLRNWWTSLESERST